MKKTNILPQRILNDIRKQQFQSEILVAVTQLFILSVFFILFLSTPTSFAMDAPVHSTALGLSLFTILVLLRLWFALTHQLNNSILAFFVVAEMSVLISTIWALHLQFESEPSLYLKSTALFYVFILIALRCLRFEPIWVLLSGFTAAVGWIILILFAIRKAPTDPITWDYVTYMSSSKIHLFGEADKVLSIIMVTIILSVVLSRARSLLIHSITKTQATNDLSQFFDPDVAKRITDSEVRVSAGYSEVRAAVILFIDIRGFTILSTQLKPSEIIEILAEYQQLLVPIIQQNGGNIDKFLGDGIMASFGAVKPSDHYAKDALDAIDQIIEAVERWKINRTQENKPVIKVGAALASGEVIYGVIGNISRLEYTVIGNAVNFAAKLEKHTKEEKVAMLTTFETLQLAETQGYKNASNKKILRQRKVSGTDEPLDLVILD